MRVLALKPGHDGAVVLVEDGRLVFSIEAEKDSGPRHGDLGAPHLVDALGRLDGPPDVVALGGWHRTLPGLVSGVAAGYRGVEPAPLVAGTFAGHPVQHHTGSHERSHVVGAVAMSPHPPDRELAVLVWEGVIGSFYRWRGPEVPIEVHPVLDQPGARYAALWSLSDPGFPDSGAMPGSEGAGKLMALAGLADGDAEPEAVMVVEALLRMRSLYPFDKRRFRSSPLHNCGSDAPALWRAARRLTDDLFDVFWEAARSLFPPGLPLVVAGGCGLNCEWNTRWRTCGHFSEVFVPPCPDDSGSAIGTAADASRAAGGPLHLDWDTFAGLPVEDDLSAAPEGWVCSPLDLGGLSAAMAAGDVVAWMRGRAEIGPRALGHRSFLADARRPAARDELNRVKQREWFRPVAPICREHDLATWFDRADPDPHMLTFRRVLDPARLGAVAHVDGTARVQSVDEAALPTMSALLSEHQRRTGVGVLCNTSLNHPGRGFVNRTTDLLALCELRGVRHAVVEDRWFRATDGGSW